MGQLILPNAARIYLDTVTVIYAVEQTPTDGVLLNPLWHSLQARTLEVFSSELTLMETLVVPLRNSDTFLVDAYDRLLRSPQMQLIPISQTILREAARLRASTPSLRTPDAIHIATATISGCTQFLTNDRQLRAATNLPVVILDEVLTS
ncbi:PIN domain-containing protein [Calothrix sp. FACHB-1219]|uniref:type II toxin-antitoxin system VapC family toxin n=1 Tax=unclassified Calothrix TaxID=2619626 RepID=UPI001686F668|nr:MULTISPECIES: PIN domain-containing protein [unclassified Calothrix]MBD2201369.1 PIN domain-containing protein [Calothrix sp. FACHB-168]MBD2215802.1 PIN domain-containing protein [Calothrix sp. FACHB-1219]